MDKVVTATQESVDVDARRAKAFHEVYSYLLRLADEWETAEKERSQAPCSVSVGGCSGE